MSLYGVPPSVGDSVETGEITFPLSELSITIADNTNKTIAVVHNDTTNNQDLCTFTNTTTGKTLKMILTGTCYGLYVDNNSSASDTASGIYVDNTGCPGYASYVYTNHAGSQTKALTRIRAANAAFDQPVLQLDTGTVNAPLRLTNFAANPTGAHLVGDLCVVDTKLCVCTVAGTPGTWAIVGTQT